MRTEHGTISRNYHRGDMGPLPWTPGGDSDVPAGAATASLVLLVSYGGNVGNCIAHIVHSVIL